MPAAVIDARIRDLARRAAEAMDVGPEPISISDATYALCYAIVAIASTSGQPGEMIENVIAMLAQSNYCKGRPIANAVLEACGALDAASGAGN